MTLRRLFLISASLLSLLAPAKAQEAGQKGVLNGLGTIQLKELKNFAERPLFAPGRRAPAPVEEPLPEPKSDVVVDEPVADPVEPPPALVLAGVIQINGEPVAVVRGGALPTSRSVRIGEALDAWTVKAISDSSITLEGKAGSQEIKMFEAGKGGRPPDPYASARDAQILAPGMPGYGAQRAAEIEADTNSADSETVDDAGDGGQNPEMTNDAGNENGGDPDGENMLYDSNQAE